MPRAIFFTEAKLPKISEAQKALRRQKILSAATEVFGEKGYSETTIDDIGKRSGISKGGIYTYFASKEAIFLEIAEQRFTVRSAMIHGIEPSLLVSEQVDYYIRWFLDSLNDATVISRSRFSYEFWTTISRQPEKSYLAKERYAKFAADLKALMAIGVANGEFRKDLDIDSAVYNLLSTMDGMGYMSTVMGVEATSEAIHEFVAMFIKHWRR